MRIIRGKYGKRRFQIPHGFTARPTTDFAKENLFNVLENQVIWEGKRALDLFAGTGSIGFELLSRSCAEVVAVENNRKHYQMMRSIAEKLGDKHYHPVFSDVYKFLASSPGQFDIVFADPPYDMPGIAELPSYIEDAGVLAPACRMIIEHPGTVSFEGHSYLDDTRVYGSVHFSIFVYP